MKSPYRLGVDLGGTKIEAAILDSDGTTVSKGRTPTPRVITTERSGPLPILSTESNPRPLGPTPLGIGVPGSLSPKTGLMRNANSTCLNGGRFSDLASFLKREVRLANDANCLVLSEATDGAAADASVVFGIILHGWWTRDRWIIGGRPGRRR